jgi:hypothetical protein
VGGFGGRRSTESLRHLIELRTEYGLLGAARAEHVQVVAGIASGGLVVASLVTGAPAVLTALREA